MVVWAAGVAGLLAVSGCGMYGYDQVVQEEPLPGSVPIAGESGVQTLTQLTCVERSNPGIADLEVRFATANNIEWNFLHQNYIPTEYRIGLSQDAEELEAGTARWMSPEDLPQLGDAVALNHFGQSWLTSYGHQPGDSFYAQVVALEADGKCSKTNLVWVELDADYQREAMIFSSAPVADTIPSEFVHVDASQPHYEWAGDDTWANLRLNDLALDVSAEMLAEDFDRAVVEFRLAVDNGILQDYSVVQFAVDNVGVFVLDNILITQIPNFVTYQIPLRHLHGQDAQPLDYADLANTIDQVGVGTVWPLGSTVRFDDVRIRW